MATVIAFMNMKGGVAKSTATVHTAGVLADEKKRVLVVDLDPQGHASQKLGFTRDRQAQLPISTFDTLVGNDPLPIIHTRKNKVIDLAPANASLGQAEAELGKKTLIRLYYLSEQIDAVQDKYDYILIDTPGVLNHVNTAVLMAANYVVIPVFTDTESYSATEQTLEFIRDYTNQPNIPVRAKLLGVFISQANENTIAHKYMLSLLKEGMVPEYKTRLFDTIIGMRTDLRTASQEFETITEFDPTSKAAQDYIAFTKEMVSYIKA